MTHAELYYFICRCLTMDTNPERRPGVESDLVTGRVPWEAFVWMGSSHFVLPALYSAFKRHALLPLLPADLAEHLSGIYHLNFDRNQQILQQSKELVRMLNQGGIEPVFLKGAGHLLQNLYPDPGDRVMSDIDILVPENQVEAAAAILYAGGYAHPKAFADYNFDKHHHLPGFEHPGTVAMVELHHSALAGNFGKLLPITEILSDRKKITGLNAWVLSTNHQRVLNFVHDQLVDDDFTYKTMLIKGLYDFFLLSKQGSAAEGRPVIKGFEKQFKAYCYFVHVAFGNPETAMYAANTFSKRYKRHFDYLMDHPKVFSLYQLAVLYRIRVKVVTETIFTAPFSKSARMYFKKKAGSIPALKKYLKGLRNEL